MPQPALDIGSIVEMRTVDSECVASRRFDSNHIRAKVGEPAGAQRQALVAEIDDDGTGEREVGEVGDCHQSRLGSYGCWRYKSLIRWPMSCMRRSSSSCGQSERLIDSLTTPR